MPVWECTNEQYHSDTTHDSHSSLDMFHASVEQYAALRVFKTIARPAPTEPMVFGSLFHTVVLEPERIGLEYAIERHFDRRTKQGKIDSAQFAEENSGKKIVTQQDIDQANAMTAGIIRNPVARLLLLDEDGQVEGSYKWVDAATGCKLKMRVDLLIANGGSIVDLKSTKNPSPAEWMKAVDNFGYHRQAAMYLEGAKACGMEIDQFIFLAVSKEPPHECVAYELDERAIYTGREENKRIMQDLAARRASNDWSGRWSGKVQTVSLPTWHKF